MIVIETLKPAQKLVGKKLGKWTVIDFAEKLPNATGGHFSIGYKVRSDEGNDAFLKAIDLSRAFMSNDPTTELEELTKAYNIERQLLEKCKQKNFDRVVKAIEHGSVVVEGIAVPYLIFERADGDIRALMDLSNDLDLSWTLRMLHNATVGLKQLHSVGIAHQDLKPSNVLVFDRLVAKLADLGRSSHPDFDALHDGFPIPGDLGYAAPELRYSYQHPDFRRRRYGADLFLLGNIVLFAFTRQTMSALLWSRLAPAHMPVTWRGSYDEVLPYLQKAFDEVLSDVEQYIPQQVRSDIIRVIRELCEPDVLKRGDPKSRGTLSLERYVTTFNVLTYKAERKLFR